MDNHSPNNSHETRMDSSPVYREEYEKNKDKGMPDSEARMWAAYNSGIIK